jgi:hypothetical protein
LDLAQKSISKSVVKFVQILKGIHLREFLAALTTRIRIEQALAGSFALAIK